MVCLSLFYPLFSFVRIGCRFHFKCTEEIPKRKKSHRNLEFRNRNMKKKTQENKIQLVVCFFLPSAERHWIENVYFMNTRIERERERKAESKRNEQTANKQITIINFAVVCACLYVSIIFHHLTAQIPFYRSAVRSDHLWICNAVKWFPSEISRQPHGCESVSVFSRNAYLAFELKSVRLAICFSLEIAIKREECIKWLLDRH